jgi:membrane-bound metal-dependent hydrolase YbcI (DUF457 family)
MKIPEHLALSYLLAQLGPQQTIGPTATLLIMAAGMLPDLDGVSILGGWSCHLKYHRKVGHGLFTIVLGPLALTVLGGLLTDRGDWWVLWPWLQLSLLLHLFVDVLFYRWPVQLFWPFSNWGAGVGLVSWNDLVPTLLLYIGTAAALLWPPAAVAAATVSLGLLAGYVALRASRRAPFTGWLAWLTGGWARRSPRLCRWLTGDFVT